MTTEIQAPKIEEQARGRLLFNVRAYRPDFLDEAAVLRSTLDLEEQLTATLRLRLTPQAAAA